ncbi:hypothetical protein ACFWCB_12750 [Streptomyces sp. NPDC060048]|uniref:hypothetical protein n=1 Tax=unclassified Streptomyces TaxID=2593676 RepID=UPI00367654EF
MELRRGLRVPLNVAALILAVSALTAVTAGCVTVRPVGPGAGSGSDARPGAAEATGGPTGVWPGVRAALPDPVSEAQPLGTLPGAPSSTPAPGPGVGTASAEPAPAARERSRAEPVAPRGGPERPRRAKPGRPAAAPRVPAPAAKARGSRPAPKRTYDMAPLCAAARGRVDPAIVALCH